MQQTSEVKILHYIGKIDKNKIGKYGERLITQNVILTEERKLHILQNHKKDYKIIIKNIDRVILKPKEILIDAKNVDTLFFIGNLERHNLNVIVKLNTSNDEIHPQNSVMTAWIIRDKNLDKLRKNNKIIYKDE